MLGYISTRTCADRPFGMNHFIMHREHEALHFRKMFLKVFDEFQSMGISQSQINNRQTRYGGTHNLQGLLAILGFTANDQIRFPLDDFFQRLANQRMIVNDQNACARIVLVVGLVEIVAAHGICMLFK